jgi:TPR repeat protein
LNSVACNNLGAFVWNQDKQAALEWYKKSARFNNPFGLLNLAASLLSGSAGETNSCLAAYYYRKSATFNNFDAINALHGLERSELLKSFQFFDDRR